MNNFERILLGILASAPSTVPIFVHSTQGIMIANAGEILLANILAQFANQTPAPVVQPVAPVAPAAQPIPTVKVVGS